MTYTARWVVYCLMLLILMLSLPGPDGFRVVFESARIVNVFDVLLAKPLLSAYDWLT